MTAERLREVRDGNPFRPFVIRVADGIDARWLLLENVRGLLTARGRDRSRSALLTRAGKTTQIDLEGVDDHSPTDAIAIDATRILVLHRRFTMLEGQGAALSIVDLAPALAGAGGTLPARLLARWEPPLTLDNMEGLALRREGGRLFVYLVSDDNLNSLQRTLLMKFELDLNALGGAPRP